MAAQRETNYIQCFHDCPIMEWPSTLILLSSSKVLKDEMFEVIPNWAKLYFMTFSDVDFVKELGRRTVDDPPRVALSPPAPSTTCSSL